MTTPTPPTTGPANPGGPAATAGDPRTSTAGNPATATDAPAPGAVDRADLEAQNAELRRQLDAANASANAPRTAPANADDRPEPSDAQKAIGTHDLVTRTAHNPYAGENQSTYGVVVARDTVTATDPATGETVTREVATVAWLRDVADPIDVAELEPVD